MAKIRALLDDIAQLPLEEKADILNELKLELHRISPFKSEPVDCVLWVKNDEVYANDYNPNSVAPPEMKLLEHSIMEDGYTQPIVSWKNGATYEVVDGFHRNRVGKESVKVRRRVHDRLPVTIVNDHRTDRSDRIAATIRHNRARGKHKVEAMSDIVVELKRRNWSDDKIARELGMDSDEVLRLCQITGLAEAFKDHQFSEAWESAKSDGMAEEILSDVADGRSEGGPRIYHTYDKWECYKAGFYADRAPSGMTQEDGEEAYRLFLADIPKFEAALRVVTTQWKFSCEHYLTNDRMNRVAWLGQASVAQALGIPSICRGGYNRLSADQKAMADAKALEYLNKWLLANNREAVSMKDATGRTEADLY